MPKLLDAAPGLSLYKKTTCSLSAARARRGGPRPAASAAVGNRRWTVEGAPPGGPVPLRVHRERHVLHLHERVVGKLGGERVVVGGEQRERADPRRQVGQRGVGDRVAGGEVGSKRRARISGAALHAAWLGSRLALPHPSNVAVPRPSSSRMTRERGVAAARMRDVSCSSTMNVELPAKMLSLAPAIRAVTRQADTAGKKKPVPVEQLSAPRHATAVASARTDAREDAIKRRELHRRRRHVGAQLRHHNGHADLRGGSMGGARARGSRPAVRASSGGCRLIEGAVHVPGAAASTCRPCWGP